jgi:hypothetical protein
MIAPGDYRLTADLMRVRDAKRKVIATLSWGDKVRALRDRGGTLTVDLGNRTGTVRGDYEQALVAAADPAAPRVLKADFVDVQQGDGAVLETPEGKVVLVDGGENKLFARYLARRFQGSSAEHRRRSTASS